MVVYTTKLKVWRTLDKCKTERLWIMDSFCVAKAIPKNKISNMAAAILRELLSSWPLIFLVKPKTLYE